MHHISSREAIQFLFLIFIVMNWIIRMLQSKYTLSLDWLKIDMIKTVAAVAILFPCHCLLIVMETLLDCTFKDTVQ